VDGIFCLEIFTLDSRAWQYLIHYIVFGLLSIRRAFLSYREHRALPTMPLSFSTEPTDVIDGKNLDLNMFFKLLKGVYGVEEGNNNFRVEVRGGCL
jgi:hypothetical protein